MTSTRDLGCVQIQNKLKVKWCKKIFHENSTQKRAVVTIPISDKIEFISKKVAKSKKTLYINERFNSARRYNNYKSINT